MAVDRAEIEHVVVEQGRGRDGALGLVAPAELARIVEGEELARFRAKEDAVAGHGRPAANSGAGLRAPGAAPGLQVHGVQVAIVGPKENVTLGDARRGSDRALRVIGPLDAAAAGRDGVQTLVLRTDQDQVFVGHR